MMAYLVVLSVLATITVNGLANALPINGQTTGEISNRFEVFFTPANYVFAIWGLIYLGLLVLSVYQALPAQRDHSRLQRARPWIALSGPANVAWLLLWHYEQFPLTMLAMLGLFGTLVVSYQRLRIGQAPATRAERWAVQAPISLYLGWISVATIANATVLLAYWEWGGWGVAPEIWTIAVLAAALAIGWMLALRRKEFIVPAVLVWAFVGIALRNSGADLVAGAAWIAALIAAAAGLVALWSGQKPTAGGPETEPPGESAPAATS